MSSLIDIYALSFLQRKKSIPKQTAQLHWWKKKIGHYLLSDITPSLIAEQRDNLLREVTNRGEFRSAATAVRYMAALSHAFTVAVKEWGWIDDSIVKSQNQKNRGRVRFLDEDERTRLLAACRKVKILISIHHCIGLSTGMRQGEILNLKWSDVDIERGRVILHETKNGEIRQVLLLGMLWS